MGHHIQCLLQEEIILILEVREFDTCWQQMKNPYIVKQVRIYTGTRTEINVNICMRTGAEILT